MRNYYFLFGGIFLIVVFMPFASEREGTFQKLSANTMLERILLYSKSFEEERTRYSAYNFTGGKFEGYVTEIKKPGPFDKFIMPEYEFRPTKRTTFVTGLVRKGQNIKGDPTIVISLVGEYFEHVEHALGSARWSTTTQSAEQFGKPGVPEGTFSGLPIGAKSWYGICPKINSGNTIHGCSGDARLVVYDEHFCFVLDLIHRQLGDKGGNYFECIKKSDLLVGEYFLRMLFSKAYMAQYDFNKLQKTNVSVGSAKVNGVKVSDKFIMVPVNSLSNLIKGKMNEENGVYKLTYNNKTITLPVGARKIILGKQKIDTPIPILYDGKEVWVEKNALTKALETAK